MSEKRILITGAAGYIGSALMQAIAPDFPDIRAIDNFSEGVVREAGGVRVEEMDVTNPDHVKEMIRGVHILIHLAAITGIPQCQRDPVKANLVNLTAIKYLVEAGLDDALQRVIFPSSFAVYGIPPARVTPDAPLRPVSYYGILKRTTEDILLAAHILHDLDVLIFRQSNIYGKALCPKRSLINLFCDRAIKREPLTLVGTGRQVRDFIHIRDAVKFYHRALLNPRLNGMYHLGSGQAVSIKEILDMVVDASREILAYVPDVERRSSRVQGTKEVDVPFHFDVSRTIRDFEVSPALSIQEEIKCFLAEAGGRR